MLVHSGVKWTFHGETFETWGARKKAGKTGEFGALPIIKKGNRTLDLSIPSLRSLGMELGYYPTNDYKMAAVVDMVSETYSEVFDKWAGIIFAQDKNDAEKAEAFSLSLK